MCFVFGHAHSLTSDYDLQPTYSKKHTRNTECTLKHTQLTSPPVRKRPTLHNSSSQVQAPQCSMLWVLTQLLQMVVVLWRLMLLSLRRLLPVLLQVLLVWAVVVAWLERLQQQQQQPLRCLPFLSPAVL